MTEIHNTVISLMIDAQVSMLWNYLTPTWAYSK